MTKGLAFVSSDMISLVAFDFVLRVICRGMVRVPFVLEIPGVNLDNRS